MIDQVYPDGHQGFVNWTEDEVAELTRRANANGVTPLAAISLFTSQSSAV